MAEHYSRETSGVLDTQGPARNLSQNYRSKLKRIRATIVMAAQADGDTIVLGELPVGAVFAFGLENTTATLGTTQVAIGIAGTPAKYKAAATMTTADSPRLFGKCAPSAAVPLAATERLIATLSAAAMPGAGTYEIDIFYSDTV